MTSYIILFLLVVIISKLIERNKNNFIGYVFAGLLLLLLSLFAGIRSIDMGWDASKYVVSTFYRLNYFNGSYLNFMNATTVEWGFSAFSWLLYHINSNINFLMFGYSFITTLFIMIFAFREKEKISISKVLIIYYLTLYVISFNIIRQSICIAILLVSISYYKDKKYIIAWTLFFIACISHDSAFLALPIFIMYSVLCNSDNNAKKVKRMIAITICAFILCCSYTYLIQILYNIGMISQKYYTYFLTYNKVDYNISNIFINMFWLFFACIFLRKGLENKKFNELIFNIVLLSISLAINIVSIKIHPIYRVGYYYYYLGLFNFVPSFNGYIKNDNSNKRIANFIVFGVLILMFMWMTVLGNAHNIYPYHSDIVSYLK